MTSVGLTKASRWSRFFAVIIDGLVVTVIAAPLVITFADGDFGSVQSSPIFLVLYATYEIGAIACFGWTLGKFLFRVRVTTNEVVYTKPGLKTSVVRYVVKTGIPMYLLLLAGLAKRTVDNVGGVYALCVALSLLFSKAGRGIHDLLAKTFVIDANN